MKPVLFYLCGLPASGKSYQSTLISTQYNAKVHASDKIREEIYTDINNQDNNELVFKTMFERTKNDLKNGTNVVYDATNINYKRRKAFVENLNKIDCWKVCVLMATPYEDCLKQNQKRDRQVPEHIISNMYKNFYIPQKYEGWDDIVIVWNYDQKDFDIHNLFNGANGLNYIEQDNPNHTHTVGMHCLQCAIELEKADENVSSKLHKAALLHDIGKRFTKEFKNSKGEDTDIAHYYQHHLVSAYDSLFYGGWYSDKEKLEIANYIQWHMQPFLWSDKSENKYRKLWGEEFYNDIMLLHEADFKAH